MINKLRIFLAIVLTALLIPVMTYATPETITATVVNFSEYEQGTGTHPVMMTVTDKFLRIDDSIEAEDFIRAEGSITAEGSIPDKGFVLYDRKEKMIYSVSAEEQQIVTIKLKPVTMLSPIELKLRSVTLAMDKNAPLIDGKKTQNLQYPL